MSATTPFSVKLIRRGIPTQELLADVAAVARRLQTDRLSGHRYYQLGHFHHRTIIHRFGSWKIALKQVGLRPAHLFHVDAKLAIADLRRVARHLNTQSPRLLDYRRHGRFTTDCLRKLFGAWHRAVLAAGLRPGQYRSLTDAELFDNLKKVWQTLGRQPRMKDIRPPLSICTVGPYLTRYKTWTQALNTFDRATNPRPSITDPPPFVKHKCVSTHINWRLRYQILQRDHFRCQACGQSPATDPNITLQIDHIHPRSQGGPSTAKQSSNLMQPMQQWEKRSNPRGGVASATPTQFQNADSDGFAKANTAASTASTLITLVRQIL